MSSSHFDTAQWSSNNPILANLDSAGVDSLITASNILSLPKHHTVFKQGDIGNDMYFILSGEVEVNIMLPSGDRIEVNHLYSGDTFGEIALFDQRQRTASIKTLTPCQLLQIQRDHFIEFLYCHPEVAVQLLGMFAKQVRSTHDLMKNTLNTNIATRLAKTINNLAHAYGRRASNGLKIDCQFSDEDFSEISGLPTEVIHSHLQSWCKKGLISFKNGYVTIHHPEELDRLETRFT